MTFCELGDATITDSDFRLLSQENSWLNDNIIGFYLEYLKFSLKRPEFVFIHPSAAFMLKLLPIDELTTGNEEENPFIHAQKLETWFIFIPINNAEDPDSPDGTHWSLLVINKRKKVATHFDSSLGLNKKAAKETFLCIKNNLLKDNEFTYEEALHTEQQGNGYDCGVYTLLNIDRIVFDSTERITSSKTKNFRNRLHHLVVEQRDIWLTDKKKIESKS